MHGFGKRVPALVWLATFGIVTGVAIAAGADFIHAFVRGVVSATYMAIVSVLLIYIVMDKDVKTAEQIRDAAFKTGMDTAVANNLMELQDRLRQRMATQASMKAKQTEVVRAREEFEREQKMEESKRQKQKEMESML